ncbi:MAG: glutamine-hydrolyzing carbamoyl-phosphate synthase small subunit [Acidobacteria bacterium]|nr:glutamine-hydrolyzing carbamoyl-phosphate synthase small subunit [Acidobacteriota bacterium]MCI0723379.1 glutamine-hydrolyzing carbamoyl-phosphate synthase small subunit [Acidobacteriota bacterium]
MEALLALEDGRTFRGKSFGADGEVSGEIVFNTSLTGYQEILTDPSYAGQVVVLTYPLIGNYGVNPQDAESARPFAEGLVVREMAEVPSNWRQETSLPDYLRRHNIVGISEIDTRALVRHIRTHGAMRCMISTHDLEPESLVRKTQSQPVMAGQDLVKEVTCRDGYPWQDPSIDLFPARKRRGRNANAKKEQTSFKVVAFDFGIKHNILRLLVDHGCELTVVPATTGASQILSLNPDGIFLSNGPGDPEPVTYAIDTVRQLLGKKPIFGICLGHQILGLALGGRTYKLKFGHRGGNHPVLQVPTGQVEITAQNHGFAVDIDSLPKSEVEVTHINLNDQTLEGFRHKTLPVFCVQYHPESSPGPHDSRYLFDEFKSLMLQHKQAKGERGKAKA